MTAVASVGKARSKKGRGRASTFLMLSTDARAKLIAKHGDNISVTDLAEIFGVSTQTVRRWIGAGYLPAPCLVEGFATKRFLTRQVIERILGAVASKLT